MNTVEKVFSELKAGTQVSLASMTASGYPRPVPMSITCIGKNKEIWFATSLNSEKVKAYRENPKAGVSYYNDEFTASMTGKIRIVEDSGKKREMWHDTMSLYFPDGAGSKDYCLLQFIPELLRAVTVKDIYKYEVKTILLMNGK
jgi:general stress protein 26